MQQDAMLLAVQPAWRYVVFDRRANNLALCRYPDDIACLWKRGRRRISELVKLRVISKPTGSGKGRNICYTGTVRE